MKTISENAALRKNSISIEMILCHDCDQQKCQDIISMKFFHCDLEHKHSVNVTVLQMKKHYASHNRVNFHIPFTATGT